MKKTTLTIKVLALVLLWFGLVGASSALTLSTTDPAYVGNLSLDTSSEAPYTWLATNEYTVGTLFYTPVEHLYSFTFPDDMLLVSVNAELRSESPMTITIYDSLGAVVWNNNTDFIYSYDGPSNDRDSIEVFPGVGLSAGLHWLVVTADPVSEGAGAYSYTGSYDLYLKSSPAVVPLPPALLLFGSSLLGFITLGWRRSKA
jgi:hypothetical protein